METIGSFKQQAFIPGDMNRLDRESGMLLATVDSLAPYELAGDSYREGWTLAHVVAHLTLSADALTEQVDAALSGTEQPYRDKDEHLAAVETQAQLEPAKLKQDLHRATDAFERSAAKLAQGAQRETAQCRFGDVNAYALPMMRLNEVLMGHHDLGTIWELDEADIDALEDALGAAAQVAQLGEWPTGVTLRSTEGEEYVFGDGKVEVTGERSALLGWLTRGLTAGVRGPDELPASPYRLFL